MNKKTIAIVIAAVVALGAAGVGGAFAMKKLRTKEPEPEETATFCLQYESRSVAPKFRIGGLDGTARYKVTEIAPQRKSTWADGKVLGGDFLTSFGLNMDLKQPYQSAVLLLERQ